MRSNEKMEGEKLWSDKNITKSGDGSLHLNTTDNIHRHCDPDLPAEQAGRYREKQSYCIRTILIMMKDCFPLRSLRFAMTVLMMIELILKSFLLNDDRVIKLSC